MVTINIRQEIADFEAELDEDGRIIFDSIDFKKLPISDENIRTLLKDKTPQIQQKYAPKVARLVKLNQFLASTEGDVGPDDLDNPFEDPHASDADKRAYLVTEIMNRRQGLKTFRDTGEILDYQEGRRVIGAETFIRQDMKDLGGYKITDSFRREVLNAIRDRTYADRKEFDADPNILNLKNGLLDVKTGEFRPHTPDYLSVVQLPVNYDPEIRCHNFVKFLRSTLEQEHALTVLKMMGYLLLRNTIYEKAFMLVGEGSNGKSTLIKVLERLVGKYNCSGKSLQDLTGDRFAAADLYGKMANFFPDLPSTKIAVTGIFKALVSGDRISAQRKYGQPFTSENYAKLVFSCNEIPPSDDKTYAYMRRWVIIPFNRTFEGDAVDEHLLEKMTTPEELSGILNLALCGLKKLRQDRGFRDMDISEIKRQYEIGASRIRSFIGRECVLDPGNENLSIEAERLRDAYRDDCREHGTTFFNERQLGEELKRVGVERRQKGPRTKKVYHYIGIQLKKETLS